MSELTNNDVQPSGQGDIESVEDVLDLALQTGQDKKGSEEQSSDQDNTTLDEQPAEYEIEAKEYKRLTELGYGDEDLNNLDRQQVDDILKQGTKKPEIKTDAPQEVIITEQMAKDYGVAKNFIRKPVSELLKAFQNNLAYTTKLEAETKKYNDMVADNEKKKIDELQTSLKDPGNLTEDELITKIEELAELRAQEKLRAMQPQDNSKLVDEFYTTLQPSLPEGMKAETAFNGWLGSLTPQQKEEFSTVNANIIARAIIDYAKAQHYQTQLAEKEAALKESEKNTKRNAKKIGGKLAVESIRASNGRPVNGSKFSVVDRTTKDRYEGMDKVAADILRDSEN